MKLSLDALKERAGATASMDLLASISGGIENACHDDVTVGPGGLTGILTIDTKNPNIPQPTPINPGRFQ